MSAHRSFEDLRGTRFGTTDDSPHGCVKRRGADTRYFTPEHLVSGPYSGLGAVGESNVLSWYDLFSSGRGVWWHVRTEMHQTRAVVIDTDAIAVIPDEAFAVLEGLQDYPVISEEQLAEVELEDEQEAWRHSIVDFMRALEDYFDTDTENLSEGELYKLFRRGCEAASVYWEHGPEGPYIDVRRVARAVSDDDLVEVSHDHR